jgi:hypothetical protein
MDPRTVALLLQHRHADGSWSAMVEARAHHDAADHDAERGWRFGRIFRCASCSEEVAVDTEPHASPPGSGRP